MALSGSFYTNVNSHWRLQLEWTGSQSISGNYTDITAKMYWIGRDQYGTTYTSDTKDGAIIIDGSTYTFSGSGLAKLSGSQKKLIHTATKRINHGSDGKKSISLGGYFNAELTLSGTYYGRVNLSSKSYSLNTIPRTSKLTSSPSWTAGNNLGVTISRASSSFTHTVNTYVKNRSGGWDKIKGVTGITTSKTITFSSSELTDIFKSLDGRSSAETRIYLDTFNGSTKIGFETYYGTVKSPSATTVSNLSPVTGVSEANGQGGQTVWIDQPEIKISLNRRLSGFTHTVKFKNGNSGSVIHTATGVGDSYTWKPTQAERDAMYKHIPTSIEFDGDIEIITYYNGVQVQGSTSKDINFRVRNSNPTFSASNISYKDTNSNAVAITGNDQYIVQNVSDLTAYVNTSAKAINGATLKYYVILVNGQEETITTATGSKNMGKITAGTNQTLTIKAVDSRGNSTSVTKTVTVVPYKQPTLSPVLARQNKFENLTRIDVEGTFSALTIGGANKNLVKSLTYRYKERSATSYGSDTTISFTTSGSTVVGNNFALDLDNTKSWDFVFTLSDKLSNVEVKASVGTGSPILFVDSKLKSVGVGVFPVNPNTFEVAGNMSATDYFGRGFWGKTLWDYILYDHSNGNVTVSAQGQDLILGYKNTKKIQARTTIDLPTSEYRKNGNGGGINANNSDITGVNGVWFGGDNGDLSDNDGEGLIFPRSDTPSDSLSASDFDTLRVMNRVGYLNGEPMFMQGDKVLWSGAWYMQANQTVTPSMKLTDCPNGWILVWSDFDEPSKTEKNYQFVHTPIHKVQAQKHNGTEMYVPVPQYWNMMTIKTLEVYDNKIVGSDNNISDSTHKDIVLRYVIAF